MISWDQIKWRKFEAPGCDGCLLTGSADNLEEYFHSGKELATYETFGTLVDTIRYFLDHEEKRLAIAEEGYKRTLAEHTYVHRFRDIFRTMGVEVRSTVNGEKTANVVEITA